MERKTYLDRYRVILDSSGVPVELASSVAGITYKAEDVESGALVAVELIRSEMLSPATIEELAGDAPKAHELDHPNIARVHDVGLDGEHVVYVREFLEGSTLQEWVASHGPLPLGAVLRIGSQVVSALSSAAFHSIRHRSIQPANLMIVPGQTPEGEWPLVKVLNFGAPPPTFQRSGFTTVGVGNSAQFASPEQLVGGTVDFRSEIYSLGCTLWFLLTGAPPATDVTVSRFSGIPKNVRKLIGHMIAVDADERPKDPLVLQEQLRDCLARVDRREAIGRRFGVPLVSAPRAAAAAPPPVPTPVAAAPAVPVPVPQATVPQPGVVPPPAVTQMRTHGRGVPWKSLALAAMLVALGAVGALLLTNGSNDNRVAAKDSEAIGVPIGVPENAAVTAANTTNVPAPEPAESPAAVVAADNRAEPPVVTATESAAPAESPADTTVAENTTNTAPEESEDTTVAANTTSAAPAEGPTVDSSSSAVATDRTAPQTAQATAPQTAQAAAPAPTEPPTIVASNTSRSADEMDEPAPPAEGPGRIAAAPSAPPPPEESTFIAPESSDSGSTTSTRTTQSSAKKPITTTERKVASAETAPEETTNTPATARKSRKSNTKREREEVRVAERVNNAPAEEAMPALPKGTSRARYLGTREDGAMVFSLPSSERVYAAPPAERKVPSPRRRLRRLLAPDPAPVVVDPAAAPPVEEYEVEEE